MNISIVTINYNNKVGLEKTINSVINQEIDNIDFVIIDGGSNDGSLDLIKKFSSHLNYWVSEPDGGIYDAMNKGISKISGDYVIFLNSGDYLVSKVLRKLNFSKFTADFILFDYFDNSSNELIRLSTTELSFKYLFQSCPKHQAIAFKTNLFLEKKYNSKFLIVGDWEFIFDKVIFHEASYQGINTHLVFTDEEGVSATNKKLLFFEREEHLKSLFPAVLIKELNRLYDVELKYNSRIIQFLYKTSKWLKK